MSKVITLSADAEKALRIISLPENYESAVNALCLHVTSMDKKVLDKVRSEYGHGLKEKAAYVAYIAYCEVNGQGALPFDAFLTTVYTWAQARQVDASTSPSVSTSSIYVKALPVMALLKKHNLV